jgi:hypothetical protein
MAQATIKIFPTLEQIQEFGYSSNLTETLEYLAATFSKGRVNCDVAESGFRDSNDFIVEQLAVWIDGIAVPFDWVHVIGLTAEEKAIVENFTPRTISALADQPRSDLATFI